MKAILLLLLTVPAFGKTARIVFLENENMGVVHLKPETATVLSFPTKPEKVICGNKNHFSIEFIENDVVITPTAARARSNLFVYLFGRRFGFDLVTSESDADEIVVVRDRPPQNERQKSKNR